MAPFALVFLDFQNRLFLGIGHLHLGITCKLGIHSNDLFE